MSENIRVEAEHSHRGKQVYEIKPQGVQRQRTHLRCGGGVRVLSKPGLDVSAFRNKFEADPQGAAEVLRQRVVDRVDYAARCREAQERNDRRPHDNELDHFRLGALGDLRQIRDALAGAGVQSMEVPEGEGSTRAAMIQTEAFPLLMGALAVAGVNEAYEAVPTVGEQLVTELDDVKDLVVVAGVVMDGKDKYQVKEGEEFVNIGSGQEKFLIEHLRYGLQTTISQEAIEKNDIAGIEARWTALGRISRHKIEEQTIKRVIDFDGSASSGAEPYVLHGPRTTAGRALFATANTAPLTRLPASGNRITSTPLVSTADLETIRKRFALMRDENGAPILVPNGERVLFVPDALWMTAWNLVNSGLEPGVLNQANFYGPMGPARPMVLSSPYLDDLNINVPGGGSTASNADTSYYYGAPRRQFRRHWALRPELSTFAGTSTEAYTRTRQAMRVRLAWDCEVGATDYVYWLQILKGTTHPSDNT